MISFNQCNFHFGQVPALINIFCYFSLSLVNKTNLILRMTHPKDHKDHEIQKKLAFLNQLLERNPELKNQYDEFMIEASTSLPDGMDTQSFIEEEAAFVKELLENVDLDDPDWDLFNPPHDRYIPEYEAWEHVAEAMIAEQFEALAQNIKDFFSDAKFQKGLLSLVGAYDACRHVEIHDPNQIFYDHEEILLSKLHDLQTSIIEQLDRTVIPDYQIFCFIEGLFHHYENYHESVLRFFEPLVLTLIREKSHARFIVNLVREKNIQAAHMPRIATEMYRLSGDRELWIKTAETLIHQDIEVARNLLEEYRKSAYDDFIRTSKQVWLADRYRNELADFIFENIRPDTSPEFYKEVLLWLTSQYSTPHPTRLSRYRMLRKIFTPEEKEQFLEKQKTDHLFYAEMLRIENRLAELPQFVRENIDSFEFHGMIHTILETHPEESFEILRDKILLTLEKERGRNVYRCVVGWLLLIRNLPGMKKRSKELADQLFHWKPRLPALRDELKQAGFVN